MPTQMGRMAVPCVSFSTTMGMLVTGSIINPRIFISTSIAASPGSSDGTNNSYHLANSDHLLPHQAVGPGAGDANFEVFSHQAGARRKKIYHAVARCATRPLAVLVTTIFHQHLEAAANEALVAHHLDLPLALEQHGQAADLFFFGDAVRHGQRRRVGPRRKFEGEDAVVLRGVEKRE